MKSPVRQITSGFSESPVRIALSIEDSGTAHEA